jgi:HEAT repeat protein
MREHRGRACALIGVVTLLLTTPSAGAESRQAGDELAAEVQAVLERMVTYELGDSREALAELHRLVLSSREAPEERAAVEQRLAAFLLAETTLAGAQAVSQELSVVGTGASVPALSRLLARVERADVALYALQRIPDAAVDAALREALPGVAPATRVAVINVLGERGQQAVVADLAAWVESEDREAAGAAVVALGKLGGIEAAEALAAARAGTSGELHRLVSDAYLRCADGFAAGGDADRAASMYRDLYDNEDATAVRIAALRGLVRADESNAVAVLLSSLRRDNRALQSVAAGLLRHLPDSTELGPIVAEAANLAPPTQAQVLSALAARGDKVAYPVVVGALVHHDEDVRVAAISALATLGSAEDIGRLAGIAAAGRTAADQEAARETLAFLPGPTINAALIEAVPAAAPEVRAELVAALGDRYATEAIGALLEAATDAARGVRIAAQRALAIVAEPTEIDAVIERLMVESDAAVRSEAERTVALVARKISPAQGRAGAVLATLPSAPEGEARDSLIVVLGRIGDSAALPAIRSELQAAGGEHQRAAIAALTSWPDADPAADLLQVARSAEDATIAILALRGYIGLLRRPNERPEEVSVGLLREAMSIATEPAEQRMALAGLGDLRSVGALRATVPYLDVALLQPEAEAALRRQVNTLRRADDETFREVFDEPLRQDLDHILQVAQDPQLREWVEEVLARGAGLSPISRARLRQPASFPEGSR